LRLQKRAREHGLDFMQELAFMFRILFASDALTIGDYRCDGGHASDSGEEVVPGPELIFVRSGAFTAVFRDDTVLLSAAHALLLPREVPYRIKHPIDGSDTSTIIRFTPEGWDMAGAELRRAYRRPRAIPSARSFLMQQRLVERLSASAADQLEAEESAWSAVDAFQDALGSAPHGDASPRMRGAVVAAQELITAKYRQPLPLSTVAAHAEVSQFHLSRAFRRITGITMHRFQVVVRLRAALQRLDQGSSDLTDLALDLGFSDHSHFCGAFRREFGMAPSEYRALAMRDRSAIGSSRGTGSSLPVRRLGES
jgi:AraC family transcriptional regulator